MDFTQNITIIFSMHKDNGKCNANELYAIIENQKPEVIFEEFDISRTEDDYYKNGQYKYQNSSTVETKAIMRYLENNEVAYIPVDTYEIDDPPVYMYNEFSKHSQDYSNLVIMDFNLATQGGYPYLNSEKRNEIFDKIILLEDIIAKNSNDSKLIEDISKWRIISDNRDDQMLDNIYNYCYQNAFKNAIFIVGADHRKSLLGKIYERNREGKLKIKWNIDCL